MHKHNTMHTYAADGTKLAYELIDADGPTFLFCNGYATTHFYWRHVLDHFRGKARLITWDYRGHGRSGPSQTLRGLTMADVARDIEAILDATDTRDVVLFGFSYGCQVIFEAYRHLSDRVIGMVPLFGTFEHPFNHVFHPRLGPKLFKLFQKGAGRLAPGPMRLMGKTAHSPIGYRLGQLTGMIEWNIPHHEMKPFFEHYNDLHVPSWVAMGEAAQAHSARDVLPTVDVPTLIISGGKDSWTPFHMSEQMRQLIPSPQYHHLPKATHTALLGHAPVVIELLDAFIDQTYGERLAS